MSDDMVEQVKYSAQKRILFLPHTIQQMSRPERMITTKEVAIVVATGELIEDYPDDVRGHSCLLLGYGIEDRVIHVVCSPKEDYLPNENQWSSDFRRRLNQ